MSIEIHNLGRLRFSREATFGTQVDFSAADAVPTTSSSDTAPTILSVPAIEGSVSLRLEQDVVDPNALVVYRDQKIESELGIKRASLTFSVPIISAGATTNTARQARNSLMLLLRDTLGGENLTEGFTTSGSASGTPTVTFDVGSGNSETDYAIFAGSAIAVPTSATAYEWRPVQASGGSTVTLAFAASGSIATSTLGYGCSTYYPAEDPQNSLQFAVYGIESDDRWQLLGGQLESLAISTNPGGIPQLDITMQFANWLHGSSSSTLPSAYEVSNSITGTLSAPTYSSTNYVMNTGGFSYWSLNGTTTYSATEHATSAFPMPTVNDTYTCGVGYSKVSSPSGVQTVARYVRNRSKPALSGQFSIPYENVQWFQDKTDKLNRGLFRVFNGTAGSMFAIDARTIQVVDVQRVDEGGLAYQQVSWEARHDAVSSDTSNSDDALVRAAFRLHLG